MALYYVEFFKQKEPPVAVLGPGTPHNVRLHINDLMRLVDGVGVEWGIEWVVKHLVEQNVEVADTEAAFEESVRQCYPEEVTIGWITYDTVSAIKELDRVSWDMSESEWIDQEVSEDNLVTFDLGSKHYTRSDIETYLDEVECELEAAG